MDSVLIDADDGERSPSEDELTQLMLEWTAAVVLHER